MSPPRELLTRLDLVEASVVLPGRTLPILGRRSARDRYGLVTRRDRARPRERATQRARAGVRGRPLERAALARRARALGSRARRGRPLRAAQRRRAARATAAA